MGVEARDVMSDTGDCQHPTFLGVRMGQWWQDLQIWEWFLNEHPGIGEIIEIGTWEGGFATYLNLQCLARGMRFRSFDIQPFWCGMRNNLFLWSLLGSRVEIGNAWYDAGKQIRKCFETENRAPILLFCDGGNKPKEFKLFAPSLRNGDFLAVHDWCVKPDAGEFHPSDVDEALVETVYKDICDRHDSHTRFFQKRKAVI